MEMETTLFDRDGNAVAYIADDYRGTIYLWEGNVVAYVYEDRHIYGFNGRHLGWFIDDIIFNYHGERIGFTSRSCPVPVAKESVKPRKGPMEETRSRWTAPPSPKPLFHFADQALSDFLKMGRIVRYEEDAAAGTSSDGSEVASDDSETVSETSGASQSGVSQD